jgi:hypothetical protein
MDNAPIHVADDMLRVLETILDLADVRLFFLPKYSPELNPCEMVFAQVSLLPSDPASSVRSRLACSLAPSCRRMFLCVVFLYRDGFAADRVLAFFSFRCVRRLAAQVKRYLREQRGTDSFRMEVAKGFQRVSLNNVIRYYEHCLLEFDREFRP